MKKIATEETIDYIRGATIVDYKDSSDGWLKIMLDNGFQWHIETTQAGFVIVHPRPN